MLQNDYYYSDIIMNKLHKLIEIPYKKAFIDIYIYD